jgi:murein DD-endopeptidase MepM/ murein hydrolase activator NlpD
MRGSMGKSRYAVVILDSTGRPSRRLSVSEGLVRRCLLAACLLMALISMCGIHGIWAARQARTAQRLAHTNGHLRALTAALTADIPAARDAAALAELNFVQLWAKSGLGLEPGLLDVAPAADATEADEAAEQARPSEVAVPGADTALGATPAAADAALAVPAAIALRESAAAAPAALIPIDELDVNSLPEAVRHLTAEGRDLSTNLGETFEYFHDAERMLLNTPSIRPARTAWYSSSYGIRLHPITHVLLMHKGLDMGGFVGMEIFAPADGVVIWTGTRGGYGQVVVIDHGFGLQTHFAHLSRYLVKRGQRVRRGQRIAEMGTTGHSTGPHLHYEVRRYGQPLDPRRFILD